MTVPAPGQPLSSQHRATAWQEYLDSFTSGGSRAGKTPWSKDRWDTYYDLNMTRPTVANIPVVEYHAHLGWGSRQVTVPLPEAVGKPRKFDIADTAGRRGVEVKSGYIRMGGDVTSEIQRDAWLIKNRGWTIEYHFAADSRASDGVLKACDAAGIRVTGLK